MYHQIIPLTLTWPTASQFHLMLLGVAGHFCIDSLIQQYLWVDPIESQLLNNVIWTTHTD